MAMLPGRTLPEQINAFRAKVLARLHAVPGLIIEGAGERLIARTPVKSGLLASSYNYAVGTPDLTVPAAPGQRVINGFAALPKKAAGLRHFITSGVFYGPFVEHGTSKMAPRAMVALTMVEMPDVIRDALVTAKTMYP